MDQVGPPDEVRVLLVHHNDPESTLGCLNLNLSQFLCLTFFLTPTGSKGAVGLPGPDGLHRYQVTHVFSQYSLGPGKCRTGEECQKIKYCFAAVFVNKILAEDFTLICQIVHSVPVGKQEK